MQITSEDIWKYLQDRQSNASEYLTTEPVRMTHELVCTLWITFGLFRVAEAIENAKTKTT